MQTKNSKAAARTEVEYTERALSGWGGLVAVGRFFQTLGLGKVLSAALPPCRSNNHFSPESKVLQFFATILTGGSRFDHAERVRSDEVVRESLGADRFGSASAITSYFGNLTQSQSEHAHQVMNKLVLENVRLLRESDVLDLDSTVFDRYGQQEGSAKGYHPSRPGMKSHHPLLAMFAAAKVIAHVWLRSGAASPHRGCREFLAELLAQLPAGFRISAVRADSGFCSNDFLAFLEEKALPYAIRLTMRKPTKWWCASLTNWQRLSSDREITEGLYFSPGAKKTRRVIVVREARRRESEGTLFEIVDYEYSAIVTTLTAPAVEVWKFYNGRGDCENRIKELKNDFNAAGFCLKSFAGTETAFRLTCFLFNVVSLFKALVLSNSKATLGTIRNRVLVIGASVGHAGRRLVFRLGLKGKWRVEFDRLLAAATTCLASTSAELNKRLNLGGLEPPSPWSLRNAQTFPRSRFFNSY